jgi:membrane protease YdiL (CAAX protease family)
MNSLVFFLLLAAGCAGIVLAFAQARSRAVFAADGLADPARRAVAGGLLGAVLLLTVAIPFAGGLAGGKPQTKQLTVVSLFAVHAILLLFLIAYYFLTRQSSWAEFLKLKSARPIADVSSGVLIGFAGWALTVCALLVVVVILYFLRKNGLEATAGEVSPMIRWLHEQPLMIRLGIVLSAMVIEELFFRSFLQTRVGPVAATLLFTAAHGVYGQPLVLVGILVISAVLSTTFVLYRNVLPCIMAHGTFDAIQMFVVIPLALRAT